MVDLEKVIHVHLNYTTFSCLSHHAAGRPFFINHAKSLNQMIHFIHLSTPLCVRRLNEDKNYNDL